MSPNDDYRTCLYCRNPIIGVGQVVDYDGGGKILAHFGCAAAASCCFVCDSQRLVKWHSDTPFCWRHRIGLWWFAVRRRLHV